MKESTNNRFNCAFFSIELYRNLKDHISNIVMNVEKIETYPGWMGEIDHLKAEKYLLKERTGTYLLRKGDPITKSMEEELILEGHHFLQCYVLTAVEEDNVIKEYLIIKLKKGWVLYNDESNLNQGAYPFFHSLHELLLSLQEQVKYPIQR